MYHCFGVQLYFWSNFIIEDLRLPTNLSLAVQDEMWVVPVFVNLFFFLRGNGDPSLLNITLYLFVYLASESCVHFVIMFFLQIFDRSPCLISALKKFALHFVSMYRGGLGGGKTAQHFTEMAR